MAFATPELSLREAAVFAGVPFDFAQREVEKHTLKVRRKNKHVFVGPEAATYLALVHHAPFAMPKHLRVALYVALTDPASKRSLPWERFDTRLRLPIGEATMALETRAIDDKVRERARLWASRADNVVSSKAIMDGEPVFKGTRIPVSHVVELLHRGVSREYLREHLPTLSDDHCELARLMKEMGKRPGRPKLKPLKIVRSAG